MTTKEELRLGVLAYHKDHRKAPKGLSHEVKIRDDGTKVCKYIQVDGTIVYQASYKGFISGLVAEEDIAIAVGSVHHWVAEWTLLTIKKG